MLACKVVFHRKQQNEESDRKGAYSKQDKVCLAEGSEVWIGRVIVWLEAVVTLIAATEGALVRDEIYTSSKRRRHAAAAAMERALTLSHEACTQREKAPPYLALRSLFVLLLQRTVYHIQV